MSLIGRGGIRVNGTAARGTRNSIAMDGTYGRISRNSLRVIPGRDGDPLARDRPLPAAPSPVVQQRQLVEQPSVLPVRSLQLLEKPLVRFVFDGGKSVRRGASGRLSLRLVLRPLIGSSHSITSSRVSFRRAGSDAAWTSSLRSEERRVGKECR